MNKYKKLISNTLILGIGTFGSKLMVYFLMPLYTGFLSPSEYAVADIIAQTANLIIPLACIGISNGVFRFAADREKNKEEAFSAGMLINLGGSMVFLILSPILFFIDYFKGYAWLIVLYVIFANFHSVCANYIRAVDKTKLFALQGILNTLLTITLNVIFLVVFRIGIYGYVLSVIIADILTTLFVVISQRLWKVFSIKTVKKQTLIAMLKYSIPLIPATMFWWITDVSDRYFVSYFCSDEIMGLYSVAYKIPTVLILISGVFIEAWQFSAVNESGEAGKPVLTNNSLERFFDNVFDCFTSLIFLACSLIIATSKIFASFMFADAYYTSWQYMPVLVVAMMFSTFVTFMGTAYIVKMKTVVSFLTAFLGALMNIVLNFIFIPPFAFGWGAMGAAVATAISYFTVFVIRSATVKNYIKFKIHYLRVALNVSIIVAQSVIMILQPWWWITAELISIALIVVVNFKVLFTGIKQLSGMVIRKYKN